MTIRKIGSDQGGKRRGCVVKSAKSGHSRAITPVIYNNKQTTNTPRRKINKVIP
jgi:hypothetical protein